MILLKLHSTIATLEGAPLQLYHTRETSCVFCDLQNCENEEARVT